jgi:hypothetical protein
MINVVRLNVIMMNVVMLSVVARLIRKACYDNLTIILKCGALKVQKGNLISQAYFCEKAPLPE